MASEWTETTLGSVVDFLSGGTPSKNQTGFWCGSIPWVSAKDMKRLRLDDTEDHVSQEGVANGTRLVPKGTVLILARGMTLLDDVPICIANRPMTFNQDVKALRPKPHVRDDFLPYLLLGNKQRLLSLVDLAGHGTGRLNSADLKALDILLPPETEQRAIAHILGTLDDKVELNRRMNETLEAMARAIFKSWFVDFDPVRAKADGRQPVGMDEATASLFPDSFEDSPLGKIPKGWGIGKIEDLATISREGLNPADFPDETFDYYSIPAFDDGRFPKTETGFAIKSNKFTVRPECVLLSKLNPRIPRVWLPDLKSSRRAVCSTGYFVMTPHPCISKEFLFCLFSSREFRDVFATLVTGTSGSHQRVTAQSLLSMEVLNPPASLIECFTVLSKPLFEGVCRNLVRSCALAAIRDLLLPKLISGELRAKDADRLLHQAAEQQHA